MLTMHATRVDEEMHRGLQLQLNTTLVQLYMWHRERNVDPRERNNNKPQGHAQPQGR